MFHPSILLFQFRKLLELCIPDSCLHIVYLSKEFNLIHSWIIGDYYIHLTFEHKNHLHI